MCGRVREQTRFRRHAGPGTVVKDDAAAGIADEAVDQAWEESLGGLCSARQQENGRT